MSGFHLRAGRGARVELNYRAANGTPRDSGETAEELARLAAQARNPAERVWYLQWAQAFSQLAAFGAAQNYDISATDEESGR